MPVYKNSREKTVGFITTFVQKLEKTNGSPEFWREVVAMSEYFKADSKVYAAAVILLEELAKDMKKGG